MTCNPVDLLIHNDLLDVWCGDVLALPLPLLDNSVHCIITSPPYWGLRDYGVNDQLGLERTPQEYLDKMVRIFRDLRRILRKDGTLWLNMGDSYAGRSGGDLNSTSNLLGGRHTQEQSRIAKEKMRSMTVSRRRDRHVIPRCDVRVPNLKPKDLCGMPWRLALALQADGWYLRCDIIWNKPNPMPESVYDRPTKSHEYLFLLTKSEKYFYDIEATKEPASPNTHARLRQPNLMTQKGGFKQQQYLENFPGRKHRDRSPQQILQSMAVKAGVNPKASFQTGYPRSKQNESFAAACSQQIVSKRNKRTVWTITTKAYKGAHFACVDAETEALTLTGWRRHNELTDGTLVAAYVDGHITWQPATFHRYDYDGDLIKIEKRDSSQRLTPNHRCLIRTRLGHIRTVEASELTPAMQVRTIAPWKILESEKIGVATASLLGWYIAEGWRKSHRSIKLSQSETANPQHVKTIRDLLAVTGAEAKEKRRERSWRGRPTVDIEWTITGPVAANLITLAGRKRMEFELLNLPTAEAQALLDALIDGDGHRRPDGRACIIQKNKESVDAMQALALRLGYRAQLTLRKEGTHALYLTKGSWLTLRGTNGKHRAMPVEHYTGVVWCPSVASGYWLARRSGKTFITGNTFPPKLVEPCILAGTSAKGCCPNCGAPWKRIVEKGAPDEAWRKVSGADANGEYHGKATKDFESAKASNAAAVKARILAGMVHHHTAGWIPTCKCPDHKPVPCTILDPFGGSGTTAEVAINHGRRAILFELNPDYIDLIRKRVLDQNPLFAKPTLPPAGELNVNNRNSITGESPLPACADQDKASATAGGNSTPKE